MTDDLLYQCLLPLLPVVVLDLQIHSQNLQVIEFPIFVFLPFLDNTHQSNNLQLELLVRMRIIQLEIKCFFHCSLLLKVKYCQKFIPGITINCDHTLSLWKQRFLIRLRKKSFLSLINLFYNC